jgi:demethylmenaquinone methyltransferase/2-methoxy-6-polyprenyl-1,4-benzoquinol methylase
MSRRPSDRTEPDPHSRKVEAMFGRIAPWYDLLNRLLSFGQDIRWRNRLVAKVALPSTRRVLDLAAGTLDVSRAIAHRHPEASLLAMDFSVPMLKRGRPKMAGHGRFLPVCADARRLPLASESVDCVTIAFGIRNIRPRSAAFAEIRRALTPGGRLAVLEFGTGRDRIWGGAYNLYLGRILPGIGRLVSKDGLAYGYLAETIKAFPSADALAGELRQAGFEEVTYESMTSGIVYLHTADKPRQESAAVRT